jgi:hypothetical protein
MKLSSSELANFSVSSSLSCANRLSLIKWLKRKLTEKNLLFHDDFGEHTWDVKKNEREEALSKRIILATFQKSNEGLDVPRLDTLILATSVSDVIQSNRRILRTYPDKKKNPMVIDIWDNIEPNM